jgi:hypothetical protein
MLSIHGQRLQPEGAMEPMEPMEPMERPWPPGQPGFYFIRTGKTQGAGGSPNPLQAKKTM